MRIGISGFVLGGGKTGVGIYVSSLLKALQKIDQENEYFIHLSKDESQFVSLASKNFTPQISANMLENPILNILWQNSIAPIEAKAKGYDIFHVPSIRRAPLVKGCPVITTVHDLAPFKIRGKYDIFRSFYHHNILSKVIHQSDHVITVSNHTKSDLVELLKYPEEDISVIYPGVDHEIFNPQENASEQLKMEHPFFVYVSRIEHPGKNHVRMIEAFEKFKLRTGLPNKLICAGAQKSKVHQDIHLLGFASVRTVVALYSACDLMIYPSLYEGFGLPVTEAMACGAPVICSNNSSLQEVGNGVAGLFDPSDPESICQAMIDGISENFQQKSRLAGPKHAAQFQWEKTAREVLDTYKKVLR